MSDLIPFRHNQTWIVIGGFADPPTDWPRLQQLCTTGGHQRLDSLNRPRKPVLPAIRWHNHRHTIMNRLHHGIGTDQRRFCPRIGHGAKRRADAQHGR